MFGTGILCNLSKEKFPLFEVIGVGAIGNELCWILLSHTSWNINWNYMLPHVAYWADDGVCTIYEISQLLGVP